MYRNKNKAVRNLMILVILIGAILASSLNVQAWANGDASGYESARDQTVIKEKLPEDPAAEETGLKGSVEPVIEQTDSTAIAIEVMGSKEPAIEGVDTEEAAVKVPDREETVQEVSKPDETATAEAAEMKETGDEDVEEVQRLVEWLEDNKWTGGTFQLKEDLVIDGDRKFGEVEIYSNMVEFTLDVGEYAVIIKNNGALYLDSGIGIRVIGKGSPQGMIQVGDESVLYMCGVQINASGGTAIRAFQNGEITLNSNCAVYASGGNAMCLSDQSYAYFSDNRFLFQSQDASAVSIGRDAGVSWPYGDSCVINAFGNGVRGIESDQPETRLSKLNIRVEGRDSIGVYGMGSIYLEETDITASGENALSVSTGGSGAVVKRDIFSELVPEAEAAGLDCEKDSLMIVDIDDNYTRPVSVKQNSIFEEISLPQKVMIRLYDTKNDNYISSDQKVTWSKADFETEAAKGRDFTLEGNYEFNQLQKEVIVNDGECKPRIRVKFVKGTEFQNINVQKINSGIKVSFLKPWDASKLTLEYSFDAQTWKAIDITAYIKMDSYDIGAYRLQIPADKIECYVRLYAENSVFEGYTDTWIVDCVTGKCGVKDPVESGNTPEEGEKEESLPDGGSGGDRGGGGTTEPDRKPNTPQDETKTEDAEDPVNSQNDKTDSLEPGETDENTDSGGGYEERGGSGAYKNNTESGIISQNFSEAGKRPDTTSIHRGEAKQNKDAESGPVETEKPEKEETGEQIIVNNQSILRGQLAGGGTGILISAISCVVACFLLFGLLKHKKNNL